MACAVEDDLATLLALADGDSSARSAKRPRASSGGSGGTSGAVDLTVEPFSGIRIQAETRGASGLSHDGVQALASSFEFRRLADVPPMLRNPSSVTASWLTIGVLVDRGPTKPTQGGGQFCVWKLSDLKACNASTTVSVFLFGEACSASWKYAIPGTVFAVLAAKAVPRKESTADTDEAALSIKSFSSFTASARLPSLPFARQSDVMASPALCG